MRVLLKFSGEKIPLGNHDINKLKYLHMFLDGVKSLMNKNIGVCIVIGGGNIYRGGENTIIKRSVGDRVGMLSTVINATILSEIASEYGISNTVLSAIAMPQICNTFNLENAHREISNKLIIFAGGTSASLVTTDTAAVIRAIEMQCSIVVKLTQVDGIYSANPKVDTNAKRYSHIRYIDAINRKLQFMDSTSIAIAYQNQLIMRIGELKKTEDLVNVTSLDVESSIKNFTTIY